MESTEEVWKPAFSGDRDNNWLPQCPTLLGAHPLSPQSHPFLYRSPSLLARNNHLDIHSKQTPSHLTVSDTLAHAATQSQA